MAFSSYDKILLETPYKIPETIDDLWEPGAVDEYNKNAERLDKESQKTRIRKTIQSLFHCLHS